MPQRVERCTVVTASSRNNEVTTTTVPAGHHRPIQPCDFGLASKGSGWFLAPLERGPVDPDAVQDNGQFSRDCHLRFFHAIAFRQPQSPRPLTRTTASSDGAACWRPRRDKFAADDLPIARLGRQCPFHPIACGVASGPNRLPRRLRFESETGRRWYGGRSVPSSRRCPARS